MIFKIILYTMVTTLVMDQSMTDEQIETGIIEHHENDVYSHIIPANGKHTATVIFIHGLHIPSDVETSNTWSKIFKGIKQEHTKVICPSPYSIKSNYNTSGTEWYYTAAYVRGTIGIKGATEHIQGLIDQEIKNGIPPERIVIGGNDQGGIIAINSAVTYPKKLGGIVAVNTHLRLSVEKAIHDTIIPANKDIPMLNCDTQKAVNHKEFELVLKKISNNVETKAYKPNKKVLAEEGVDAIKEFLDKHIAPV